jgi:hypothetical protein
VVNLMVVNWRKRKRTCVIFYKRLLNFSLNSSALMGKFQEIQTVNRQVTKIWFRIYAFTRWSEVQRLLLLIFLGKLQVHSIKIPSDIIQNGIWKTEIIQ